MHAPTIVIASGQSCIFVHISISLVSIHLSSHHRSHDPLLLHSFTAASNPTSSTYPSHISCTIWITGLDELIVLIWITGLDELIVLIWITGLDELIVLIYFIFSSFFV